MFVGPRSRMNYWSCSKFADYIRLKFDNYQKPKWGTEEEWYDWKKASKLRNSFVYWFTEEALDSIQNFIYFPYDLICAIRYYFYNRFITQTHKLTSSLEPGTFHEYETRILHCVFDELVNFVEVEKAHMQVVWNDEAKNKYKRPTIYNFYPLRLKMWRCPQAGLDHLEWEMTLRDEIYNHETKETIQTDEPTRQAISAKETYELYNWWKNVRPLRQDPYDAAGLKEFEASLPPCADEERLIQRGTPEQEAQRMEIYKKVGEIEQQYTQEDQDMLIRVIKLSPALWT